MRHVCLTEPGASRLGLHRLGLAVRVPEYQRPSLNHDTHVRQFVGVHSCHARWERHVPHPHAGVVEDDLDCARARGARLRRGLDGTRPQRTADASGGGGHDSNRKTHDETGDQLLHGRHSTLAVSIARSTDPPGQKLYLPPTADSRIPIPPTFIATINKVILRANRDTTPTLM